MIEFPSGAKRSEVKPRYDLIEPCALRRLAARCGLGAEKYGDYNWQKGLPVSDVFNHVIDHLTEYREKLKAGVDRVGDDDLAGAMWGIMVLMWEQRQKRLDNPTKPPSVGSILESLKKEDAHPEGIRNLSGGSYDDKRFEAPMKSCTLCGKGYYFVGDHDICRECYSKEHRASQTQV